MYHRESGHLSADFPLSNQPLLLPRTIARLDQPLVDHCVGDLDETDDVGVGDIVAGSASANTHGFSESEKITRIDLEVVGKLADVGLAEFAPAAQDTEAQRAVAQQAAKIRRSHPAFVHQVAKPLDRRGVRQARFPEARTFVIQHQQLLSTCAASFCAGEALPLSISRPRRMISSIAARC